MANWRKALQVGMKTTGDVLIKKYLQDEATGRKQKEELFRQQQVAKREEADRKWREKMQNKKYEKEFELAEQKHKWDIETETAKQKAKESEKKQENLTKAKQKYAEEFGKYLGRSFATSVMQDLQARTKTPLNSEPEAVTKHTNRVIQNIIGGVMSQATMSQSVHDSLMNVLNGKADKKDVSQVAAALSKEFQEQGFSPATAYYGTAAFFEGYGKGKEFIDTFKEKLALAEVKERAKKKAGEKSGKTAKDPLASKTFERYLAFYKAQHPELGESKWYNPADWFKNKELSPETYQLIYRSAKAGDPTFSQTTTTTTSIPPGIDFAEQIRNGKLNDPYLVADIIREKQKANKTKEVMQIIDTLHRTNSKLYEQTKKLMTGQ